MKPTRPRTSPSSTTKKTSAGPGPKRRAALERKGDLRHIRTAARGAKSDVEKAAGEDTRSLSGKATRYLRGLGHHLDAIVQVGKEGITDGVVKATREALLAHELVKVRILAEAPIDRNEAGRELAQRAGAALAQTLGRTVLLYKRHPNKPKIVLPRV